MDSYSFGMLMWEVLYEKVPFEGEVKAAVEYVVDEDARPLIVTVATHEPESSDNQNEESSAMVLTEDLANIIRRCWQSDPTKRTSLGQVAKLLKQQQALIFESD